MRPADARELALDSLIRITEKGVFSSAELSDGYAAHPDLSAHDRSLYTVLVEGTLEQLLRIDYYLNQISKTPVRKMKLLIRNLLRMSAYQILFLDRVPDHAAVSEALRIAQRRGFGKLKGFVNAVLRNLARQKENIALPDPSAEQKKYLSVFYSCPEWIVRMWCERFGTAQTEKILRTFPAKKEICLWVNPACENAEEMLQSAGADIRPHPGPDGVFLCSRLPRIEEMEAFRAGAFYIQDFSSILAVIPALQALQARADANQQTAAPLKVIDVCGAPGGKSLYLAAHLPCAQIICRDLSPEKTAKIAENICRLRLSNVKAQQQNACDLCEADIETADLVIADLPCSGLGVIGRKADMRYRVSESDIADLARLQREILLTASRYVKPGGLLLYSTCTISQKENEEQVKWIRESLPFEPVPLRGLPEGIAGADSVSDGYVQILPDTDPYHDGFFLSLFEKTEI